MLYLFDNSLHSNVIRGVVKCNKNFKRKQSYLSVFMMKCIPVERHRRNDTKYHTEEMLLQYVCSFKKSKSK